jgi:SAM-dependent methyltransferase
MRGAYRCSRRTRQTAGVASDGDDDEGFDPGTYGRSFADVYDRWYPDDDATAAAVDVVAEVAGGGTVLELGVGTGRLALPLARRGCRVIGIDASDDMLAALATKDPEGAVETVRGDVADPAIWPDGPVDVALAANNLLCNLPDAARQRRCVALAGAALRPGGSLLVEAFLPAPVDRRERRLEVREVTASGVTLIATDAHPDTGVVTGAHVELVDGRPPRVRPWRIRTASVDEIDQWAAAAGLRLASRRATWSGEPFDPHGAAHVSRYVRPAPDGSR